MAHTTVGVIEGLMHVTFKNDTRPTRSQVENTIIPMSDRKVDRLNISSATADDKSDLSALWAAHLIALAKDVDIRTADVSINSERIVTNYSKIFNDSVVDLGGKVGGKSFFSVANPE